MRIMIDTSLVILLAATLAIATMTYVVTHAEGQSQAGVGAGAKAIHRHGQAQGQAQGQLLQGQLRGPENQVTKNPPTTSANLAKCPFSSIALLAHKGECTEEGFTIVGYAGVPSITCVYSNHDKIVEYDNGTRIVQAC